MTVLSHPRPRGAEAPAAAAPRYFAPSDAFRALRAWRAWAARRRHGATTGFALLGSDDGTLVLASENLDTESIHAIALHTHRRLIPVPEPHVVGTERDGAPGTVTALRSLDDWAIETLVRTAAAVSHSLVVGLRHRESRFELVVWPCEDAVAAAAAAEELLGALTPWIEH